MLRAGRDMADVVEKSLGARGAIFCAWMGVFPDIALAGSALAECGIRAEDLIAARSRICFALEPSGRGSLEEFLLRERGRALRAVKNYG